MFSPVAFLPSVVTVSVFPSAEVTIVKVDRICPPFLLTVFVVVGFTRVRAAVSPNGLRREAHLSRHSSP